MTPYRPYNTQLVTLDAITWTPVAPNINCNSIVIRNDSANDIKRRIVSTDAGTQTTITAGSQEVMGAAPRDSKGGFRFPISYTVCFLQAVAGAPVIELNYLY